MAIHIVLFEPEIPQNAGNIARTCACTGAHLHLVEPMGFMLTQKQLKRAGMDYLKEVEITRWATSEQFLATHKGDDLHFFTGRTTQSFTEVDYAADDTYLIFGRESRGIDEDILAQHEKACVRIPMVEDMRSLNLANSVAIGVYEVLRQRSFAGLV